MPFGIEDIFLALIIVITLIVIGFWFVGCVKYRSYMKKIELIQHCDQVPEKSNIVEFKR